MSCNWHLPLTPIFCTALLQLSLGHSFLCSCTAVACQRSRITHCRFLTQSRSASCADPVWATPNAVFTAAVELSLSSSSPFWGCIQQELDACSTCSFPYRFVSLLLSGGGGEGEVNQAWLCMSMWLKEVSIIFFQSHQMLYFLWKFVLLPPARACFMSPITHPDTSLPVRVLSCFIK